MGSLERRVESQVQLWSLLGPFLFLISIGVLVFKLSMHWYFPLSILVGIPLCVKWKIKGMAAALTFLFAVTLFSYSGLNLEERYWHVGMALAMAFSFIILTLSLEEVQGVLSKLEVESKSRLENFLRLDDTTRKAEMAWVEAKDVLDAQLVALTNDLAIALQDKEVFYKLAQLAKDELLQIRSQQDLLQQDLSYKKHQIFQLNEKLEETEITLQNIIDTDNESTLSELREHLEVSKQAESSLSAQLKKLGQELVEIKKLNEELTLQNSQLKNLENKHLNDLAEFNRERDQFLENIRRLEKRSEDAEIVKTTLSESLETLKIDLEKVVESKAQILSQLSEHQSCLKANEQEIVVLTAQKDDLENRLVQLSEEKENQINELSKNVEENRLLDISYREQLEEYERMLKQTREENDALNKRCSQLELLEAKYSEDKARYEQDIKQRCEAERQWEKQLEDVEIEKKLLSESLEKLKIDLENVAESKTQILSQLSDYQSRFKASEQEIHGLIGCKNELENRLNQLTEETVIRIKELSKNVEENRLLEKSLKAQLEEYEQIFRQIQEENETLSKRSNDLASLEAKYSKDKIQYEQDNKKWKEAQRQWEEQLEEVQIEKLLLSDSLEAVKIDLEKVAESKAQILSQLSDHQLRLKASEQQIGVLNRNKDELENRFAQFSAENENQKESILLQFEKLLNEKDNALNDAYEKLKLVQELPKERTQIELNSRQTESLYLQLKQQFQEKSQVLDRTRQELFNAQEKALALQKTLEEQELFSVGQSEALLETQYRHLINEYEKMQCEYAQEIEHLEAIICQLTNSGA